MFASPWISLAAVLVVALLVIITALKRQPGIGVLVALPLIGLLLWLRPGGWGQMGLSSPASWLSMLLLALLSGVLIALLWTTLIEPLVERITHQPHDISITNGVRGHARVLLQWVGMVWVLVALTEELIFRGFLMSELARLLGYSAPALLLNLFITSLIFGMAHWYQGPSGVISTALAGLVLGGLFIAAGFNLWLPIMAHGFIDTVQLIFIYLNWDLRLGRLIVHHD